MEGMMEGEKETVIAAGLKAPRAGAIAGILFSILLIICVVLIRLSVPDSPADPGTWLSHSAKSVRLALNLLPFAGISFLWFIGVLRDRIFYSRIGFVHEFRTLEEKEITELLNQGWVPVGVTLPNEVLAPDVIASLIRMSGGNFRLLTRLLTQIERILKVNQLDRISKEIVAAARDSLVIGQV
jgi:hypothetical protein